MAKKDKELKLVIITERVDNWDAGPLLRLIEIAKTIKDDAVKEGA